LYNHATKERIMAGDTGTTITDEQIRQRAYEISQGPDCGTDEENWVRAEQELRGENGAPKTKPRTRKTATKAS
jgi:hypothetical protein